MYKILEKQVLSDVTKLMVVEAPHVARKAKPGQFVIVIADEQGERIPLTIADHDRQAGTITLIFQEVGKSTMQMGAMDVGRRLLLRRRARWAIPPRSRTSARWSAWRAAWASRRCTPSPATLKEAGNHVILDHRRAHQGAALLGRQDARPSPTS